MEDLDIQTRLNISHYDVSHKVSQFVYAITSIVRATQFHVYHSNRGCYKMKKDARVYFYLISSENENYMFSEQQGAYMNKLWDDYTRKYGKKKEW